MKDNKSIINHLYKYITIFMVVFSIGFASLYVIKAEGSSLIYNDYTVKWVYNWITGNTIGAGSVSTQGSTYNIDLTISFDDYYSGNLTLSHTTYQPAYICIGAQVVSNTSNALRIEFTNVKQIYMKFVFSNSEAAAFGVLNPGNWTDNGTDYFTFTSSSSSLSVATDLDNIIDSISDVESAVDENGGKIYNLINVTTNGTLSTIKTTLATINSNIDGVETYLNSLLSASTNISSTLDTINTKLSNIYTTLDTIKTNINNILTELQECNDYLASIDETLNNYLGITDISTYKLNTLISKPIDISGNYNTNNVSNSNPYYQFNVDGGLQYSSYYIFVLPIGRSSLPSFTYTLKQSDSLTGTYYSFNISNEIIIKTTWSTIFILDMSVNNKNYNYFRFTFNFPSSDLVNRSFVGTSYCIPYFTDIYYKLNDLFYHKAVLNALDDLNYNVTINGSIEVDTSIIENKLDRTNSLLEDILDAVNNVNSTTTINNDYTTINQYNTTINNSLPDIDSVTLPTFDLVQFRFSDMISGSGITSVAENIITPIYNSVIVPAHFDYVIKIGLVAVIIVFIRGIFK